MSRYKKLKLLHIITNPRRGGFSCSTTRTIGGVWLGQYHLPSLKVSVGWAQGTTYDKIRKQE